MVGTLPVAPVQLPIFRNRTYIRFKHLDSSLQWFIDNGYLPDPNNPNIELIPTMTSNTNPSGTVSANAETQPAYCAFDGNESTYWYTYENTGSYIQYKFDKAKCVRKILVQTYFSGSNGLIKKFKVQASNDGSTFIDLTDTIINSNQSDKGESECKIESRCQHIVVRGLPEDIAYFRHKLWQR